MYEKFYYSNKIMHCVKYDKKISKNFRCYVILKA